MKRLTQFVKDKIRRIHHIIYRINANTRQATLQPIGRFGNGNALDADARIAGTPLSIKHFYGYFQAIRVIYLEF